MISKPIALIAGLLISSAAFALPPGEDNRGTIRVSVARDAQSAFIQFDGDAAKQAYLFLQRTHEPTPGFGCSEIFVNGLVCGETRENVRGEPVVPYQYACKQNLNPDWEGLTTSHPVVCPIPAGIGVSN